MKKRLDKKIIILILVSILVIGLTLYLTLILNKKVNVENLEKYRQTIMVSIDGKDVNIDTKYDGVTALIHIDSLEKSVYYQNNEIIYREDLNKIISYRTKYSYVNIYDFVKNHKIKRSDSTYISNFSAEDMHELLKNIYIDLDVKDDTLVNIEINDGIIEKIDFLLKNEELGNISVQILFEEMSRDFKISTKELGNNSSTSGDNEFGAPTSINVKKVETDVNILELTKLSKIE